MMAESSRRQRRRGTRKCKLTRVVGSGRLTVELSRREPRRASGRVTNFFEVRQSVLRMRVSTLAVMMREYVPRRPNVAAAGSMKMVVAGYASVAERSDSEAARGWLHRQLDEQRHVNGALLVLASLVIGYVVEAGLSATTWTPRAAASLLIAGALAFGSLLAGVVSGAVRIKHASAELQRISDLATAEMLRGAGELADSLGQDHKGLVNLAERFAAQAKAWEAPKWGLKRDPALLRWQAGLWVCSMVLASLPGAAELVASL